MSTSAEGWRDRREAGSALGLRITVFVARYLGRPAVRLMLVPVALYFLVMRHSERRASRAFLERVSSAPVGIWRVYRHFLTFAHVAADRIFFISGGHHGIRVRLHGIQSLHEAIGRTTGGIFVAAHLGSFEAARVMGMETSRLKVRMVLDRHVNRRFIRSLEQLNSELAGAIIDPDQSPAGLGLAVAEALQCGEWVSFPVDRFLGADRTIACDFMGERARFALGPFLVAAAFKAPVFAIFPLYSDGGYDVFVEEISPGLDAPRVERDRVLRGCVTRFVERLEYHTRRAPYNWFNFYPFWTQR